MDVTTLEPLDGDRWRIPPTDGMRVPAVIFADRALIEAMDEKVREQISNVARLPGIVSAALAMPDAHWGYGFPIGGVAAFDPDAGGVISAGGVGFDISCGIRMLRPGLLRADVLPVREALADRLAESIPAGVGSAGAIRLSDDEMTRMLAGGARWAVAQGYGREADLEFIESQGCQPGADPAAVSERARQRQRDQMGTLGSGNHYLEVQYVSEVYDEATAQAFGLAPEHVVISIHCGARGLGHQIGTEFLREMAVAAKEFGIELPDRELACAPITSELGQRYLGALRAATNCALANRQILTHITRETFAGLFPDADLEVLYDVSHNTCREEVHQVVGELRSLFVHRKGATRAFGPGMPDLPERYRSVGQPVIIGGSMGTSSYVLAGTKESAALSFSSACHGAGRAMSRQQALRQWSGRQVIDELAAQGILVRSPSQRGVTEEAPGAYKDVTAVVDSADRAGLARKVCRLRPLVCVKG